ncbi:hypothetical protein B0H13DRAFT_1856327 [Mycena leptocephala]|nr:hypothetical protein B0H13DRAFT_1856327 [Mycena leptocephala]
MQPLPPNLGIETLGIGVSSWILDFITLPSPSSCTVAGTIVLLLVWLDQGRGAHGGAPREALLPIGGGGIPGPSGRAFGALLPDIGDVKTGISAFGNSPISTSLCSER